MIQQGMLSSRPYRSNIPGPPLCPLLFSSVPFATSEKITTASGACMDECVRARVCVLLPTEMGGCGCARPGLSSCPAASSRCGAVRCGVLCVVCCVDIAVWRNGVRSLMKPDIAHSEMHRRKGV